MTTVTLELPDDVFSAMRRSPDEFVREMRFVAAAQWYGRNLVSQEKAATIAGMSRAEFLAALAETEQDVYSVDTQGLRKELENA